MKFRPSPETFRVEEIPLFEPAGHGGHAYLRVRRASLGTPHLLGLLQRGLRVPEEEIGCAGMKDRDAVAVQTFSVPAALARRAEALLKEGGAEVLEVRLHPHKLRTGKLRGNRFEARILLEGPEEASLLAASAARIEREGFANAFGPQRFADQSGLEEGRRLFLGLRPRGPFRRARFLISVYQAFLFNEWLELRRGRGLWPGPVSGDVLKRHDSGGEFLAEAVDEELLRRVRELEVSPAGPLFGRKMARAASEAAALEEEILRRHGLSFRSLSQVRVPGARRPFRLPAGPISLSVEGDAAWLAFTLPPGAYASVLMAELGVQLLPP
ncbi:MAG: tRNA pseudouridine(13) synthase TruD [Acidobacteriota bacterium]